MLVVPIVVPQIQWHEFVKSTQASLGRSPTRSLDEAGIAPGPIATFLQAVGEFQNRNTQAISYLRSGSGEQSLGLISITFFIEAPPDQIYAVCKIGHMSILETRQDCHPFETLLASATLTEWRDIVRRGTKIPLVIEIAKWLIKLGLRDLIADLDFSQPKPKELPHA